MGKIKEKQIEELIENLDLPDEIKNKYYEFLLRIWSEFDIDKHNLFLTIPKLRNQLFTLNRTARILKNLEENFEWKIPPSTNKYSYFEDLKKAKVFSQSHNSTQEKEETIAKILSSEFREIHQKLNNLENENNTLKETIFDSFLQKDIDEKIQFIPIEIYIDTSKNEKIFNVYSSVLDFIRILGFDKIIELPAIKASWFKRIMAKSKKAMTSEQMMNRFKEFEYGIEVNTILKQQSEIDKNESEALANILKSLDGINNGAIRIGSLLVIKLTDKNNGDVNLQVRTLSIKEMHILNKDPHLLSKPQAVLNALSKAIELDNKLSKN